MEYKRFDNTIFARIDKGEEILEQLKEVCPPGAHQVGQRQRLGRHQRLHGGRV